MPSSLLLKYIESSLFCIGYLSSRCLYTLWLITQTVSGDLYDTLLQTKGIQEEDEYGLAVYATWKLSYDKLGSSAQTLLQILSFLHHEGITEEIFKRASLCQERLDDLNLQIQVARVLSVVGKQDSKWNSLLFQEFIGDIKSYSLIEFDD